MKYIGKLYGRFDARKYFDTGKTSEDWDAMEQKIKELEAQNKKLIDELFKLGVDKIFTKQG